MREITCLVVNDIHLSDKPPRWRTKNYAQEILDKIEWIVEYANKMKVSVLGFTGDVFHNPIPSRVSYYLTSNLVDILSQSNCDILFVPGNHDLGNGGIVTLDHQPLGLLVKAIPNATILTSEHPYFHGFNIRIGGFEWMYDSKKLLETIDDISHDMDNKIISTDLLLLHAPVAQRSNPYYETIDPKQLVPYAKVIAFGHLHPPEKPYTVDGTVFVNPGALSRGSLTASDIERTPQIARIDFDTLEVAYVPVGCAKPAEEIFKVEQAIFNKENKTTVSKFIQSLSAAQLDRVDLGSLIKACKEMTDKRLVADLCQQILTEVG